MPRWFCSMAKSPSRPAPKRKSSPIGGLFGVEALPQQAADRRMLVRDVGKSLIEAQHPHRIKAAGVAQKLQFAARRRKPSPRFSRPSLRRKILWAAAQTQSPPRPVGRGFGLLLQSLQNIGGGPGARRRNCRSLPRRLVENRGLAFARTKRSLGVVYVFLE